jgi:hypothetical protein
MNVDEELLDSKLEIKEKRGQALLVYCILSFVWIGITAVSLLFAASQGQKTEAEMLEEKIELLSTIPDGPGSELSADMYGDILEVSERSNYYFYEMMGANILTIALGLISVLLMFKLKKIGYFIYIIYSIFPLVVTAWLMGVTGFMGIITFGVTAVFSVTFLILYAYQLKRMS